VAKACLEAGPLGKKECELVKMAGIGGMRVRVTR
jgi:hypothetical protein